MLRGSTADLWVNAKCKNALNRFSSGKMFFKLPIHKSYCKSITKNLEIIVYFPPTIPTTYKTAHATLTLLHSTKVFSFEKLTGMVSTWMLDMPVHSSKGMIFYVGYSM